MLEKNWILAEKFSEDILEQLLVTRGIKTKKEIEEFLNPPFSDLTFIKNSTDIDHKQLNKAVERIKMAMQSGEAIVIHGDYDVDGICATAILWETIYRDLGYRNVHPFIPDRFQEGYGVSRESIEKIKNLPAGRQGEKLIMKNDGLLITVDCGITAVEEVAYAKKLGMGVIVTDHHALGKVLPDATAVVHTQKVSGAGVAWVLAESLMPTNHQKASRLDLVALATIADIQKLLGANRSFVKYGLERIDATERLGLKALIKVASVEDRKITPYIVGWRLTPRLNAAGRLGNAFDSLRLLCTLDAKQAHDLALKLNQMNFERRQLTDVSLTQAMEMIDKERSVQILYHEEWHEGVIGLVAAKIKDELYRPTIAIAKGETHSKGSARSIDGFNIVEALRKCEDCLVAVGGHPMAAGFTIETSMIEVFVEKLSAVARESLSDEDFLPAINIEAEITFKDISWEFLEKLTKFEPHGVGNPKPKFLSKGIEVLEVRTVGADNSHLKMFLTADDASFPAIGFGLGHFIEEINVGDRVDLVYTLSENEYRGNKDIQIELKDIKTLDK